ncbi:MAG: hypothetical protein AB1Z50_06460 [Desulfuromonadales bacterium]
MKRTVQTSGAQTPLHSSIISPWLYRELDPGEGRLHVIFCAAALANKPGTGQAGSPLAQAVMAVDYLLDIALLSDV